jgi:hypothetical protein
VKKAYALNVLEHKVLRKIFGPKRGAGEWRRWHNEER